MATLVLQAAGAAIGGMVGGPTGAMIGRTLGGLAGAAIDSALFGSEGSPKTVEGPRLTDMDGLASSEGAPIPRVYGRARIGGQLIWATRFEEVATTTVERSGRSGGKALGGSAGRTVSTTYSYNANLAIGLCEGPIAFVRRVWADGREVDLTGVVMRVHQGLETQEPDPLIVAKEGEGAAPAYRGLAYVVFERLSLAPFGNRVPQFSFEVVRPVDGLGRMIRAVCLIPGATEFGYEPATVSRLIGLGESAPENRHQLQRVSDVAASLDALQALCPNLAQVSLVASWFGTDLRAGDCRIAPRVDLADKPTNGEPWRVAGLARADAETVSRQGGVAAYGGTPSDGSVIRLIRELKVRGLGVVLYPFVMMDIPADNALPDPRTGAPSQPPYPWRGRVTCDPGPDRPGTVDGTEAAAGQVAAFFGQAVPSDFALDGEAVVYSGPEEWSLRRQILHYAHLALAAGGVEALVIGSEFVGLTRIRSGAGAYPAVAALKALASDVRAVLGPGTHITYAADWTEYGAHVRDGGAEVRFPLDPLWADCAIDAVGIDYYPPISDWRDGPDHADRALARSIYDIDYLRGRLGAGEAFDWYYPDEAARIAQARAPITDGAYNKPWTFRAKDLVGWWSNPHVERVGGVETGPTAWVPGAKPIWLTEIGIPAVDKGPNGPNVFPDPKSSESAAPPLSGGHRDDLVQARALAAILSRFDAALPGHVSGANPVSATYGGPMVDPAHVFVWAWDARPFPTFPDFSEVWADGPNWQTGHWITGRIEGLELDRLVRAILGDFGIAATLEIPLDGFLDGYVIDRPMSPRAALEPLARLFGFHVTTEAGALAFRGRGAGATLAVAGGDLVPEGREPELRLVRAQESELPLEIQIGFTDSEGEYRRAAAGSRRLVGASRREARADLAVVMRRAEAERLVDSWLQDLWAGRETASFAVSPRRVEIEPGDVLLLPGPAGARPLRVVRIEDGEVRRIQARMVEPAVFEAPRGGRPIVVPPTGPVRRPPKIAGPAEAIVLDLDTTSGEPTALQHLAVAADPWPGAMAVWRSADGASFSLHRILDLPAVIGRTLDPLPPGPLWRWDRAAEVRIRLSGGMLPSIGEEAALAGGNPLAVRGTDGVWEILSAAEATLVADRTWQVRRLLRGLGGTEAAAGRTVPAGALVVRLDEAVVPLANRIEEIGRPWLYRIGPADRDHADPAVVALTVEAGSGALRPFAPVRVRARRGAGGVAFSWIRRTRRDGDPWEPVEVPLGEEREAYEVEILHAGAVVRTLAAAEPTALYPAADELADFGAPQSSLAVRVAQVSMLAGRGRPWSGTVMVD